MQRNSQRSYVTPILASEDADLPRDRFRDLYISDSGNSASVIPSDEVGKDLVYQIFRVLNDLRREQDYTFISYVKLFSLFCSFHTQSISDDISNVFVMVF